MVEPSNKSPMMASASPKPVSDNLRMHMAVGLAALLLLAGGLGGWAATAELAGAVLAQGTVVVDSNVKKVQHPSGGIVGEIHVEDGDKVAAGDLLIRLDETVTKANLLVITRQLDELAIRSARLKAERDGAASFALPAALATRSAEPEVHEILIGERSLFDSRRTAITGQKAQLRERIAQLEKQMVGITAQSEAKSKEIVLIKKELEGLTLLFEKGLVPITKYTATQREAVRLEGERAQLYASHAQAKGRIAETELQIIQLDQDTRRDVIRELRDIQAKEAELNERRIAAEDQLRRIDIRAPQAGIVHQLAVHTVGGVITSSEPVMLIVPEGDALVIEAKVAPQDIDHVGVGQAAFIRFTAFNQRTTPEFRGEVSRVAADLTREQQTGLAHFVTRIALSQAELQRLGTLKLKPGMPAEIQIRTTERTALSYLMKPLTDQIERAFRER
jgi:HlyD family secretion protein